MSVQNSSTSQRIPWSRRADLRVVPLEFQGQRSWGIKDPVTLDYFELKDEEYFVLQQLDGQASIPEICDRFRQRFLPRSLPHEELESFVGHLVAQRLVVSEGTGYGRMLVDRDRQTRSRERLSRLTNVLVVRFRGVDPDRLLGRMLAWFGWMFSPVAVACFLALILAALILVTVQFERVVERLPETRALLSPPNLIWLPILLAIVKILHEFGHGLTCKRFGGECRELGAMLLVFTPTLYCNVSDMWMVRDKWKRIAVSAAGICVELAIAATCTLLWWFSAPGMFHSLCLNLMFLCGVSTLLFNGNPLLKYDGYFVFSDWLEIPNLQQQSATAIRGWLVWWFCGIDERGIPEQSVSRQGLLLSYGLASLCYRTALTLAIVWSLYSWLEPYGLGAIVQALGIPMIGLMILNPLLAAVRFFRSEKNRSLIDWSRLRFRSVVVLILLVLLMAVPLPCRVGAGAMLDLDTAQNVHATVSGTLIESVKTGSAVKAGQEIVRLSEPGIESELIRVEGEAKLHRNRLENLERRRVRDPEVAALIPSVREQLRDFEGQLEQLKTTADRLILRAPCDGVVLPAPHHNASVRRGALPGWTGSPLDARNRGCFVQSGTTVCQVGLVESREALLLIHQDDINLVRVGQAARVVWNELAGEVLTGQITEISAIDLDLLPRDAVSRLNLPVRTTANGSVVPVGTWYQAKVQLDPTPSPLIRRAVGHAKILVDPQSLAVRFQRWLSRTFPLMHH